VANQSGDHLVPFEVNLWPEVVIRYQLGDVEGCSQHF
jgi:hypothetical protein